MRKIRRERIWAMIFCFLGGERKGINNDDFGDCKTKKKKKCVRIVFGVNETED